MGIYWLQINLKMNKLSLETVDCTIGILLL